MTIGSKGMRPFDNAKNGDMFQTEGGETLMYLRMIECGGKEIHVLMSSSERAYDSEGNHISFDFEREKKKVICKKNKESCYEK